MISNTDYVKLQMKSELLTKRLAQLNSKNSPVIGEVAEKYQLFRLEDNQFKLWGIMQIIKKVEIRKAG